MTTKFERGSLVSALTPYSRRLPATFQPLRPIVMVTDVSTCPNNPKFTGTILTGHEAGDVIKAYVHDYKLLNPNVSVRVRSPDRSKKLGDIVANEEGAHVIVTGTQTLESNGLFAGCVIMSAPPYYLHEFSQHFSDRDFKVVRRRNEVMQSAF